MKYLLDTQAWLWLFEASPEFPPRVRALLKNVANLPFGISAISPWEIAKKVSIGKLRFSVPARDWIMRGTANPGVRLLPLSPEVAWEANNLPPPFHRDPADQIIVATARLHELILISADRRIREYADVRTCWE